MQFKAEVLFSASSEHEGLKVAVAKSLFDKHSHIIIFLKCSHYCHGKFYLFEFAFHSGLILCRLFVKAKVQTSIKLWSQLEIELNEIFFLFLEPFHIQTNRLL